MKQNLLDSKEKLSQKTVLVGAGQGVGTSFPDGSTLIRITSSASMHRAKIFR